MIQRTVRVFLAAAVLPACAAPGAAQLSRTEQIAKMDSIAASPVKEGRVAGIAVAVVQGADTLLLKGYGQADT